MVIPIRDRDGRRWRIGRTQQARREHAKQIETQTPKQAQIEASGEALQMASSHNQDQT